MFRAKVKTDGRLFLGQFEKETWGVANTLEPGKEYAGYVFDSLVGDTPYIEDDGSAELISFRDDELEWLPGEYRLIHVSAESTEEQL